MKKIFLCLMLLFSVNAFASHHTMCIDPALEGYVITWENEKINIADLSSGEVKLPNQFEKDGKICLESFTVKPPIKFILSLDSPAVESFPSMK